MAIMRVLHKLSIAGLGAVFTTLATCNTAGAATMFFNDIDTFNAIAETTLIEDFETFPQKDIPLASFVSNGNTYTGLAGVPIPNVWISAPGSTSYGVSITTSSILTANGDEDFVVEFGTPTEAVGFDTYLNGFGPATVQVFGETGLLDTFLLNHDPTTVGFLGIVASEQIHSVQWTTSTGASIDTGIDNIVQGVPLDQKSVPEPITGVVLAAGLGAATLSRAKKSKQS